MTNERDNKRAKPGGGKQPGAEAPEALEQKTESRRRLVREGEEDPPSHSSADANAGGFGFTFEERDVMSDLDPQLQHVLLSSRAGRVDPALVQEAENGSLRVDVTAVRDPYGR